MLFKPIQRLVLRDSRLSHSHVIWNYAAMMLRKGRDKVAVEITPCWIAMNHHYRLTASFIHIVHVEVIVRVVVRGKRKCSFEGFVFDDEHEKSPDVGEA